MTWQLISTLKPKANKIAFSKPFKETLIRLSCTFVRPKEADYAIFHHVISQKPLTYFETKRIILRQSVKQVMQLTPIGDEILESNKSIGIVTREDGWTIRVEKFVK